jgi:succinyl-CoA synthetase beta subunit
VSVPAVASVARTGTWSEYEARELVVAHGVPVPPAELTHSAQQAVAAAARLGRPVALKVCSAAIAHKTDVGGVRLSLVTDDDVAAAYTDILTTVGHKAPEAPIDGVLVSSMRPAGVDLIAAVHMDPQFGPVLTLGLGGVWVEIVEDVAHRVLPVDAQDVRDMLGELRGAKVLGGARGSAPVDLDALVAAVLRLCDVAAALGPALDVVELNPLVARPDGTEALDVLLATRE